MKFFIPISPPITTTKSDNYKKLRLTALRVLRRGVDETVTGFWDAWIKSNAASTIGRSEAGTSPRSWMIRVVASSSWTTSARVSCGVFRSSSAWRRAASTSWAWRWRARSRLAAARQASEQYFALRPRGSGRGGISPPHWAHISVIRSRHPSPRPGPPAPPTPGQ